MGKKVAKSVTLYKVHNLSIRRMSSLVKSAIEHSYAVVNTPGGQPTEKGLNGYLHMFVEIPIDDVKSKKFLQKFECIPWNKERNKPSLREMSLNERKSDKGKLRAVVILDSVLYHIGADVKSPELAEELCIYYSSTLAPVQIFNDKGKPQIPVPKKK